MQVGVTLAFLYARLRVTVDGLTLLQKIYIMYVIIIIIVVVKIVNIDYQEPLQQIKFCTGSWELKPS